MAFRGHDESEDSNNQGNFLELLHWLCDHNPEIKAVALTNAPENLKLTSPRVQKYIVSVIASECLHMIIENIRDSFFSILVDESRDISVKEQMSVVIRYVKNGCILEHFIGVIHVLNTIAASLKAAIDQLFSTHNLSISNLRGQGYDGASNMRGEYNGLKALILKENPSAYYIHCFAHQLQLALVAVAQKHPKIETFFTTVHRLVNIVGGSAKRSDLIRENQRLKILELLSIGEISSGRELNDRFSEANNDLLICVACLSPNNSFAAFDKIKLIRLCQYYPVDFDAANILELDDQLDTYIIDMCTSEDFEELQGISDLAQKFVVKNKHEVYPLVYKLVTLTLVLPVATTTVERAFSIENDVIIERYQSMRARREQFLRIDNNSQLQLEISHFFPNTSIYTYIWSSIINLFISLCDINNIKRHPYHSVIVLLGPTTSHAPSAFYQRSISLSIIVLLSVSLHAARKIS
ncbi:uncharacterized protein LOC111392282 [Olea europaea var. sylvestris]|uniref:uncharacterized protein LOC111392282 n=1 Tax=Olea europaea var. sylvestris TaxID=158386 RepID=UPI000C1CE9FE|nr:uncharacterized protein LOC111392282 [Olea europaea var. sylvestris]